MVQTGRNPRQPFIDDLCAFRNSAPRAHIAARFAHDGFRMRDELSHMCSPGDLVSSGQLLTIDPVAVHIVMLPSVDIALWL